MKILIAEDDRITNSLFCSMLEEGGHTVLKAFDGEETLYTAKKEHPDVILLDILMPKMNGMEALRHLKADPETQDIAVIICTNLQNDETREEALQLGVLAYVIKSSLNYDDANTIIQTYMKS